MCGSTSDPARSTLPPITAEARGLHDPGAFPSFLTPFVGREGQIDGVCELLSRSEVRQVTLTGPGGVGKTRLALAIAQRLSNQFTGGVTFVDLSPIQDPALVLPAVAYSIGLRESTGERETQEQITRALFNRYLLLVLDNCEQVTAAAPEIGNLLEACPDLKILATSRAVLRLSGEHLFAVPPLDLPDLSELPPVEELAEVEAIAIFLQRAKAADPGFAITSENAQAIAAICARLDGIPLAIELAAARTGLLSPTAMLARLDRRLPLLTAGSRDAPSRQRTLRETIDWSYELLSPNEQAMFRRASIFAGGFSLEAIEEVGSIVASETNSSPAFITILDDIMSLVEQSLVRSEATPAGSWRFSLLETIREFGLELLVSTNESVLIQSKHADWCRSLAESALPYYHGPSAVAMLDQLETESDNFRLALSWSIERNDAQTAQRLAYALWRFWWMHGHLTEGRTWMEKTISLTGSSEPDVRAKVLAATGYFARIQGDLEEARSLGEEGLALAREIQDLHVISGALDLLGLIAFDLGDHERAKVFHSEALALDREHKNQHRIAVQCHNLANNAFSTGDLEGAETYFREALSIWRSRDDAWGTARALIGLGRLEIERSNFNRAIEIYFESIALSQSIGDKEQLANSLTELASIAARDNPLEAATLFAAVDSLRTSIGAPVSPADRVRYVEALGRARNRVSEIGFQTAWEAGRVLSSDEAIGRARQLFETGTVATTGPTLVLPGELAEVGLTPREIDVLRLLGAGRSNKQIAGELSMSLATAQTHVARIFAKLDVHSRAAAAAFAHRNGLA